MTPAATPKPDRPLPKRTALSPRDVLFVLFRHKRLAALAGLAVFTAALVAAVLLPPEFRSEAKLYVKFGRESAAVDPAASIGKTVTPIQDRDSELNSELQVLLSRELAEAVARRVGTGRLLDDVPDDESLAVATAADDLLGDVTAEVPPDTLNLLISYAASDPALARDVVAAYVEEYLVLRQRLFRNPGSEDFFAAQHERAVRELAHIRGDLRDLKDREGVADLTTQRTNLLGRIGDLERQADAARAARAAAVATADQLADRLASMPENVVSSRTTGSPNSSIEQLRNRLAELRIEERDVASRYVEDSPTVRSLRRQIEEAEGLLAKSEAAQGQETVSANPVRESMAVRLEAERSAVAAQEAKLARLEADLADVRGGLARLIDLQVEVDELERRGAVAAKNAELYQQTYEEARIAAELEAGEISNIRTLSPANLPVEPTGPNRKLLAFAGLLLGLIAAGGTAFAAEALDHTVKRPEDTGELAATAPCVSVPRLRSGAAVARGPGELFDELAHTVRVLFGTAGEAGGRVARDTGRRTYGLARGVLHAAVGTVRGFLWLVGAVVLGVASLAARPFRGRPSPAAARPRILADAAGVIALHDGPLVAEYDEIQDEDAGEHAGPEPTAAPPRSLGRSLRLLAYGVRRDLRAPWRRRDDRPNLQLSDRRHRTAAAEAFRRASRGILEQLLIETDRMSGGDRLPPTIAVVGARPAGGASTVAAHLAAVLAERVTENEEVRGGDIGDRRPVLLMSVVEGGRGGVRIETDGDDVEQLAGVSPTPVAGLDRLELRTLRTQAVRRAVTIARRQWRHVVLDLPPVFADLGREGGEGVREEAGPRLAALCEGTVVVLEAETLRREAAETAVERLRRAGAAVSLLVLNKRQYPVPQWIYKRA